MNGIADKEFSVCVFLNNDKYTYLRRYITAEEAIDLTLKTIDMERLNEKMVRIIITDGGDMIAFEWIRGQGITFPILF
jgi:hypothetical protein